MSLLYDGMFRFCHLIAGIISEHGLKAGLFNNNRKLLAMAASRLRRKRHLIYKVRKHTFDTERVMLP